MYDQYGNRFIALDAAVVFAVIAFIAGALIAHFTVWIF